MKDLEKIKLASVAQDICRKVLADDFFAIHTSLVEPLPHQIAAVYELMLTKEPLKFLLADDPGSGKTVMTGLLIRELLKKKLWRFLIVCPGSLTEQWQDEMSGKFSLDFEIPEDFFGDFCIARLDKLARDEIAQRKLRETAWDLIVVDEAHKMSATLWGSKLYSTKRFQLAKNILSKITTNFLLLTATPHNGKDDDFNLFLSLLKVDKNSKSMRRLMKEDLLNFDCKPLFPARIAETVNYKMSAAEKNLYEAVTEYVRRNFDRAAALDDARRRTIGFALMILQRRLASSPEAIYQSLKNRAARLKNSLADFKNLDDLNELDEENVDEIVDNATAYQGAEIQAEIQILDALTVQAEKICQSHVDSKWLALQNFLRERKQQIIIFTEHKATLEYLSSKLERFGYAVEKIHGQMTLRQRRQAEQNFKAGAAQILVATDAAGEGINLQCAHLMINYDLSWNPNRLEQRFGRIHRIGQQKDCYLFNFLSGDTREGKVFQRLFEKIETQRRALDGKVFDILGKLSFENFIFDRILNGGEIDSFLARYQSFKPPEFPHKDSITPEKVQAIRAALDAAKRFEIPPHYLEDFFVKACAALNVNLQRIIGRKGCYEILHVPKDIRLRDGRIARKYPCICFDKKLCGTKTKLMIPTEPLFDFLLAEVVERFGKVKPLKISRDKKTVEQIAMDAVMQIENDAGNFPVDVSKENLGYDIKSSRGIIEVKGRQKDADTVTVTRNEILTALKNPDAFILALVLVDEESLEVFYIDKPFQHSIDQTVESVNYNIRRLLDGRNIIFHKE